MERGEDERDGNRWGGSEMEADTERWRQTQRERDRNAAAGVMYRWGRDMEEIYSK